VQRGRRANVDEVDGFGGGQRVDRLVGAQARGESWEKLVASARRSALRSTTATMESSCESA